MKKLMGLLGSFGLVASTSVTVISCDNNISGSKDLSTVIYNIGLAIDVSKLSERSTSNHLYPSNDNNLNIILDALKVSNNDVDINTNEIEVHGITIAGAKIVAKSGSKIYTGKINVIFKATNPQVDLEKLTPDAIGGGTSAMTEDDAKIKAITSVIAASSKKLGEHDLQEQNGSFIANTQYDEGQIIIEAATYKVKGFVKVTISRFTQNSQVNLSTLHPDPISSGNKPFNIFTAQEAAIANVLVAAQGLELANSDLKYKHGSFAVQTKDKEGSIIIDSKNPNKVVGEVKVTILKLE